jgi:hypothetical protein
LTKRTGSDGPEPDSVGPLWRRLVWFVALWMAGVLVVGAAAFLIRLALRT